MSMSIKKNRQFSNIPLLMVYSRSVAPAAERQALLCQSVNWLQSGAL